MSNPTDPATTVIYREPSVAEIEKMIADLEEKFYAERKHLKAWLRSARDRVEKEPLLPGIEE